MFAIIFCLSSVAILPQNGFRRGCAAAVSADKVSLGGDAGDSGMMCGLFVHILRMAGIMDDDVITLYGICVIPFVGICHEHTSPA